MNIYVGNLSYNTTEDELRGVFAKFGEVASVNLITDKFSGQSKGFGFVEMPSNSEADAAIKGLSGTSLGGRNITVNQAKPRAERPAPRSGGGGRRY
jgi:RNA recognition motif-containing protein